MRATTLRRLDALEQSNVPREQAIKIIRLVSPHPPKEDHGTTVELAGKTFYFPGDHEEGKDLLSAMYWLANPDGMRVVLCLEGEQPADAIVIPPCPDSIPVQEYARQQFQRLEE